MKQSTSTFLPLNELLKAELAKIAKGKVKDTFALEQRWKSLVGDMVATNAKILYVRDGIAHVAVANSTWMNELGFMKADMLKRIREDMPEANVTDIRFRLAKG